MSSPPGEIVQVTCSEGTLRRVYLDADGRQCVHGVRCDVRTAPDDARPHFVAGRAAESSFSW